MAQPDLLLVPFGANAAAGTIEVIPESRGPSDPPQKATWNSGFPIVTMTPLAAGGIPPKGQDFNGVLKAISEHTVFLGGGGQYKWSAAFVAKKGGYSLGDVIQADDGKTAYVSAINNNAINFNTTPSSIGNQWLLYCSYYLSGGFVATSANLTMNMSHIGLVMASAAAGNRNIVLPASVGATRGLQVVIRRTDVSDNRLSVFASGTDLLMLDTIGSPAGQTSTELLFSGDFLEFRSDGAGKWWCVGQAQLPGSMSSGLVVFTTIGVSSMTIPPVLRSGRIRPVITVTGGGGGTGGTNSVAAGSTSISPAGGAGGTSILRVDLSGVTTVSVTVGAGGVAGVAGDSAGGNGGASSFGAYCTGMGGYGSTSTTVTGLANSDGAAGGGASGGDINLVGGFGSGVYSNGGSSPPIRSGIGGSSFWGGGPNRAQAASLYGVGGGPSSRQTGSAAASGLAGAPGIVVVEW